MGYWVHRERPVWAGCFNVLKHAEHRRAVDRWFSQARLELLWDYILRECYAAALKHSPTAAGSSADTPDTIPAG